MRGDTVYVVERYANVVVGIFSATDYGTFTSFDGRRGRKVYYMKDLWHTCSFVMDYSCTTKKEYDRWQRYLHRNPKAPLTDDDLRYHEINNGHYQPERAPLPDDDPSPPPCPHGVEGGHYCYECD